MSLRPSVRVDKLPYIEYVYVPNVSSGYIFVGYTQLGIDFYVIGALGRVFRLLSKNW